MKKYIFDKSGLNCQRVEEAEPICGEDYCDKCGDCLACYAGDECPVGDDDRHFWVIYEDAERPRPLNKISML